LGGSPARRVSAIVTSTPREARSMARVSPTGPAPTIKTLVFSERAIVPPAPTLDADTAASNGAIGQSADALPHLSGGTRWDMLHAFKKRWGGMR
jgi:hypothetical protein